ncbi:MAG: hypothetical protein AAGJ81_15575 [Verrucomicrobiota bacterium]
MTTPEAIVISAAILVFGIMISIGIVVFGLIWKGNQIGKLLDRVSGSLEEVIELAKNAVEKSNKVTVRYKKELGVDCDLEESKNEKEEVQ